MKKLILTFFTVLIFIQYINAQTVYTVTKVGDFDPVLYPYNYVDSLCSSTMFGTLQWAIRKANDTQGACEIRFNIAGSGKYTVLLQGFIPTISKKIYINGTTQYGYQVGDPQIILDGQNTVESGFILNNAVGSKIEGLYIKNLTTNGINASYCDSLTVKNCIINNITNGINTPITSGILISNSSYCKVQGNYIGTDTLSTNLPIENDGVKICSSSNNNIIGGIGSGEANIIRNCGTNGVEIGEQSIHNSIKRNIITSCLQAIYLASGANQDKLVPVITSCIGTTVTGTSVPNDIIEIFGSSGDENANIFIATTVTDGNGDWSISNVQSSYGGFIATATDANNNTSVFCVKAVVEAPFYVQNGPDFCDGETINLLPEAYDGSNVTWQNCNYYVLFFSNAGDPLCFNSLFSNPGCYSIGDQQPNCAGWVGYPAASFTVSNNCAEGPMIIYEYSHFINGLNLVDCDNLNPAYYNGSNTVIDQETINIYHSITSVTCSTYTCIPFSQTLTIPITVLGSAYYTLNCISTTDPNLTFSYTSTSVTISGITCDFTFTCRATDHCGNTLSCTRDVSFAISANISSQTNLLCNSVCTGAATVSATGSCYPYTYHWSNSQTTNPATSLCAGNYTVTVTSTHGCTATTSVTITQPTVLATNTTQANVSCYGGSNGSATVSVSGGTPPYTFLWNDPAPAQTTQTATGLTAGTWTVTVTDHNGCTKTTSVTITQPTVLTAVISTQTNVSCYGGSNGTATVSAGGGISPYTYLWNDPAPAQTTATCTALTAGTWTVTVTDSRGCTKTASVTITQPASALTATMAQTNATCGSCNGMATVTATGGTPGYTYLWNNSQTTNPATGLCAGTYTVTVTDTKGCTWTGSQVVTEDVFTNSSWPQKTNSTGDEVICDMVTDATGNVYAIGYFTGTLTMGTFTYPAVYTRDIFVVKYGPCGNILMVRDYGGIATNVIPHLYIEKMSTNELVVAGEFTTTNFTNDPANVMTTYGLCDIFLARLDPGTLYAPMASKQAKIFSEQEDVLKGLSIWGSTILLAGGFHLTPLFSTITGWTQLDNIKGAYDLFFARINMNANNFYMGWDKNTYSEMYSDEGMTILMNSVNIFFTYQNGTDPIQRLSYIVRLNQSGNVVSGPNQMGTGTDFYQINDMLLLSNGLYLCGYYKTKYVNSTQQSAIIRYYPSSTITWPPNKAIYSNTATALNQANQMTTDGTNLFVSGTYDYDNFRFWDGSNYSSAATLYTPSVNNHFVYKTNAALDATSGWLSGIAATTSGNSFGNTLCYDAAHSVYFLGGTFTGTIKLTGAAGQTMAPYSGYDGFVARFQDSNGANYLKLNNNKPDENKVENSNVIVYPNPAYDKITISSLSQENISSFSITDLTGRRIINNTTSSPSNEITADISILVVGTYFVNVVTSNNNYKLKLVKVK